MPDLRIGEAGRKAAREPRMSSCASCGMHLPVAAYHPFAACELFKALWHSGQVQANLRAVVEYGMAAERAGVSLERAMSDIAWIREGTR